MEAEATVKHCAGKNLLTAMAAAEQNLQPALPTL
jgi:hypothetical protein